MTKILVTAFEAYGPWQDNASWLCLVQLTKDMSSQAEITTRRYPVDFAVAREQLSRDLMNDYDFVLHLGQSPGSCRLALEAIALNVAGGPDQPPEGFTPLCDDGPAAYRSRLPLGDWTLRLREQGIPAQISYHAGTYLCNAVLYWTHYFSQQRNLKTQAAFVHLPLETSQTLETSSDLASMPATTAAGAVAILLKEMDALHCQGKT